MWLYEKKLEYPVKIKNPNPALAKVIISQLGGPDGEIGAATRYLQQRYSMPYGQVKGMLTDIGTEELAHVEMISAILYQLTQNLSMADIKKSGFDTYFVDHTTGAFPQFASGTPFTTAILQVTGDALADLYEDLAAEQKARLSYDNILRLIDDPDVRDPIKFLREREVEVLVLVGRADVDEQVVRCARDGLRRRERIAGAGEVEDHEPPFRLYAFSIPSRACANDDPFATEGGYDVSRETFVRLIDVRVCFASDVLRRFRQDRSERMFHLRHSAAEACGARSLRFAAA